MRIDQIIKLATGAANGKDNFKEGAVGSNGYGFVFKNLTSNSLYVTNSYSHKYSEAGSCREISKNLNKYGLLGYDIYYNLSLTGSLKILLPTIQFGGIETLFDAWVFVKTPEDQMFPATFYWRQSGLSVGGWSSYDIGPFTKKIVFPKDFLKVVNFTPFEFTDDERELFLDVLEFVLKKVPVSDFWGVFNHDLGNSLMGVRKGEAFIKELGFFERDPEAEEELESLIGKKMEDGYNRPFTINLLPGMKIYTVQFENNIEQDDVIDVIFGNAKKILEFWKSQKKKPLAYRIHEKQKLFEDIRKEKTKNKFA